jgi:hypothetical protein
VTVAANQVPNPVPTITALNPSSVTAGSAAFTLTVTGTGFATGEGIICIVPAVLGFPNPCVSSIRIDGADRVTTVVSPTQVTAAIPATDVASVGTHTITAVNPAPGGGVSNGVTLTVTPVPSLSLVGHWRGGTAQVPSHLFEMFVDTDGVIGILTTAVGTGAGICGNVTVDINKLPAAAITSNNARSTLVSRRDWERALSVVPSTLARRPPEPSMSRSPA